MAKKQKPETRSKAPYAKLVNYKEGTITKKLGDSRKRLTILQKTAILLAWDKMQFLFR